MSARMRHPDLPDQPIRVDELTVPHYQASGWELIPADEPDPAVSAPQPARTPRPAAEPTAADTDAAADTTETTDPEPTTAPTTAKARRATKEADQ